MDGNLPLSEIYVLSIFPVNVQGLCLAGKIKDNTIEYGPQIRRRDRNALCIRHCTQRVSWKQRGKEVEYCLGLLRADGQNPSLRIIGLLKTEWGGDQTGVIRRFVYNFLWANRWWRGSDVKTRWRIGGTLFRRRSWRILDKGGTIEGRTIGRITRGRKGWLARHGRMDDRRRTVCHPVRRPSVWRAFLSRGVKTATKETNVRSPVFEPQKVCNFTSGPPEKVVE